MATYQLGGTVNLGLSLAMGARAVGPSPATILANVAHWYRADLGITLATGVSQWNDLIGSAHLVQATGGNQPSYNATDAGYNGQATLQASTTGKFLAASGVVTSQPFAIWFVGEFSTAGNIIFALAAGNPYLVNSAGNVAVYAGTSLSSGVAANAKHATLAVVNGGSSFIGADNWLTGGTSGAAGASAGSAIGAFGQSNGAFTSVGKIAEVVIQTSVPTVGEKTAMAAYVLARYGITVT